MELQHALVAAYVAIVLCIGLSGRARQTPEEYLVGARSVRQFRLTAAIFATLISESLIFFAVALTARFGPLAALAPVLGTSAGLLVLSLIAGRIHASGRLRGYSSAAEYCRVTFGDVAGRYARLIIMVMLFWIVILQITLNSRLMNALIGWPAEVSVALVVGVVGAYLVLGGYFAVVRTDVFQTVVLTVMLILPFFVRPVPTVQAMVAATRFDSDVVFLFLMAAAMAIVRPELWQRVFSAQDGDTARRALRRSSLLFAVFCGFVLYYAFALLEATRLPPMEAFTAGYRHVLPRVVAAAFPVILLAAMMSSLDSAVFTLTVDATSSAKRHRERWARLVVLLILVGAGVLSLTVYDALGFALRLDGFIALLATPLVASFLFPLTARQLVVSLGAGTAAYLAMLFSGRLEAHPMEAVIGSLVTGAVLGVMALQRARVFRGLKRTSLPA